MIPRNKIPIVKIILQKSFLKPYIFHFAFTHILQSIHSHIVHLQMRRRSRPIRFGHSLPKRRHSISFIVPPRFRSALMIEEVVASAHANAQLYVELPIERRHMATVRHPPSGRRWPLAVNAGIGKGSAKHAEQTAVDR